MAAPTIRETVGALILPATVETTVFSILETKWQNLLYEGLDIPEADMNTEASWPYLGNMLISYLIIRDLVYNSLNSSVLSASSNASSDGGGVKKIETGPVNVERHDGAASIAKLYQAVFNRPGLWEDIQLQICSLASKLNIHIAGCASNVVGPLKVIRASDYSYQTQMPLTPETLPRPSE